MDIRSQRNQSMYPSVETHQISTKNKIFNLKT